MLNGTITKQITLVPLECCKCGIQFAFPREFENQRRSDNEYFYCPNGHPQHYTESVVDKLNREIANKNREISAVKCEVLAKQHVIDEKNRQIASEKASKAKLERRIKHGTCPCCKRTFERLANHIARAHPDFGPKQKRNLP